MARASKPQLRPAGPTSLSSRARTPTAVPAAGPPAAASGQPPLLETLLNVLRRRKRWILPALVLVPLLAGLMTSRMPDRYTATANILFRDAATELLAQERSFRDPADVKATNESLIKLPVVSERTAEVLNAEPAARAQMDEPLTTKAVADSVEVESVSESDLAEITAEAGRPYVAARMANVYGEEFIAFRQRSDQRQLQRAIDRARESLESLTPEQRAGTVGASYQERLNQLETTQSLLTGNAELVQRAEVPTERSSPSLARNLLLGIVLGGVLGLGLAGLRERFDKSVRTEDLEDLHGLPVLARLPQSRKLGRTGTAMGDAAETEAFRILRANLRYFNVDGSLRSILVSSPTSGDGKSTVARGLATTMAAMGDDVLLLEADLHKASSPTLGEAPMHGLSSVLTGGALRDAIRTVPVEDTGRELSVLPAGPIPPNPVELLESMRMSTLLVELEARYDNVVIDSPALAQVSDARPLVGLVSGILVVSGVGHTTRPAAVDFRKQLELLDGNAFGVVANFVDGPRTGYYY